MRRKRKLTTFYQMHNKSCPQCLSECLPLVVSDVSGYNRRNNEKYVLPYADYEKMKNPLNHPLSEFGIILVQL